jgi:lipid II:glycine glycyltransferase (peptidoglycan interpeptide bridge formation enzyme)
MREQEWNDIVRNFRGDFLQSYAWGEFHRALGWRVERIHSDSFALQLIFRPLALGMKQGYAPHGPITNTPQIIDEQDFWALCQSFTDRKTVFLEFDLLADVPFLSPRTDKTRQPRNELIISLTGRGEKEDLRENFHPTLQQNISRAERHNLSIVREQSWENFYELYVATMRRHELRPWYGSYIKTLWDVLAPQGMLEIWSAYAKDTLLASNLYVIFASRATHLFGGSNDEHSEMMAPHYLHWKMMEHYGENGIAEYDLGKVGEGLTGLTIFKQRFGGSVCSYPGNYVKVLKPLRYFAYRAARSWTS